MLKTILSVSGKPGLYKLLSSGKNVIIVESLIDKKKLPVHSRDKVVSLGDIAMYTDEEEVPLREVLLSIKKKENGAQASVKPNGTPDELKKFLGEVLPNFDRDRIYNADIKKLISWYNILTEAGVDFETEQQGEVAEEVAEPAAVVEEPKEEVKPKAKAKATTTKKEKDKE